MVISSISSLVYYFVVKRTSQVKDFIWYEAYNRISATPSTGYVIGRCYWKAVGIDNCLSLKFFQLAMVCVVVPGLSPSKKVQEMRKKTKLYPPLLFVLRL